MKKLRCIITDDEPVARKIIREFIGQVPYLGLSGEFENVQKTDAFLTTQPADILFLDIEMPGITGLQYLRKATVHPLVILTTAYPDYALEGYELDIIDYLLKPIAYERFLKAVQKAKDYLNMREAGDTAATFPWIFVKSEKRIEKIELKNILYIESLGNYVIIHTESKNMITYLTLKSLEQKLPSNEFIKIHHSFIVNLSKVNSIEDNQVRIDKKLIPISRNYREAVMQRIEPYLLKR